MTDLVSLFPGDADVIQQAALVRTNTLEIREKQLKLLTPSSWANRNQTSPKVGIPEGKKRALLYSSHHVGTPHNEFHSRRSSRERRIDIFSTSQQVLWCNQRPTYFQIWMY